VLIAVSGSFHRELLMPRSYLLTVPVRVLLAVLLSVTPEGWMIRAVHDTLGGPEEIWDSGVVVVCWPEGI
jgi:hypothetical protein